MAGSRNTPSGETPNEPEKAQEPAKAPAGKVVKFVGTSDVRRILKSDFASLEIEQGALEWSPKNKWAVKSEDMTPAALEYLEGADGFVVTDLEA